ncbi:hypothetical protein CGSSp23BS72_02808 [Streptococcus pneumoniae SP23-BS72]|nr:hypothetical protein CGSSp11BS70_09580 [Streptococcus pneumoniae SP11-BS70]EDK81849.1 hypothetical protein CGSSp23BS72_02808 [Streptococcus pneumoniae SP23-BS72]
MIFPLSARLDIVYHGEARLSSVLRLIYQKQFTSTKSTAIAFGINPTLALIPLLAGLTTIKLEWFRVTIGQGWYKP